MKTRFALILTSALGVSALATSPLSAQSAFAPLWHTDQEVRAVASINVPLGHSKDARKPAYSLDFSLEARSQEGDGVIRLPSHSVTFEDRGQRYRDLSRIAISFGRQGNLMINGQRIATFGPTLNAEDERGEERSGLSTAEKVLIGVGVIGGLAIFTATQVNEDLADLSDNNRP